MHPLLADLKPTELAQLHYLALRYPHLIRWPVTAQQCWKALFALVGEEDTLALTVEAERVHIVKGEPR